jgi:putative tryptophan/tyrosine transport system substrate-binding protein
VRRREFITLLGGAAAMSSSLWPRAARAQQARMPVIGYLYAGVPEASGTAQTGAFRRGLAEAGYVEGRNVTIEYRWGQNDPARLPALAADLVRRRVAVIVTPGSGSAARVAMTQTSTIPIVFGTGGDPVEQGLVASLNRPGHNVTGFSTLSQELGAKKLGILHELLPAATRFAVLVNPASPYAESFRRDVDAAAAVFGRQIEGLSASTNNEIDAAFASLAQKRPDGLLVAPSPLFGNRRVQIVALAGYHRLTTMYSARDHVEIGGLMSYGSNQTDQARQIGIYVGRILKGEKPGDLPVQLPAKFEFVINMQTAKMFGLTVPPGLLAIADEVIE